jgi:membrane protein YdbS with pleckstrin-like domain
VYEPLRRRALALLKVPPEPHPPMGDPASLRVFRAGRNYFRLRVARWAAAQLIALVAILFWTAIIVDVERMSRERKNVPEVPPSAAVAPAMPGESVAPANGATESKRRRENRTKQLGERIKAATERMATAAKQKAPGPWFAGFKQFFVELAVLLPSWAFPLIWVLKILSFLFYLGQIPVTYAVRRLDYEMRWYMVTDRSLRLRHGVWKVLESTMSFANVQQVTVTQGPIQRLLGLGDVKVQSAGGGRVKHQHGGEDMHLGLFHSVTNAVEIRDLVLDRLRRYRESGLGDPEERSALAVTSGTAPATVAADPADMLSAARELLIEARALRGALA